MKQNWIVTIRIQETGGGMAPWYKSGDVIDLIRHKFGPDHNMLGLQIESIAAKEDGPVYY